MTEATITLDEARARLNPVMQSDASTLKLLTWTEAINIPAAAPLVKGWLNAGRLAVMYGAPNCGKTFLAFDIACHVAQGWRWMGNRTAHGLVVYIAAEGLDARRMDAFDKFHADCDPKHAKIAILPRRIDLRSEDGDTAALVEAIRPHGTPALIIVDTLNRTLAGGDENSSKDMGALLANADAIRQVTGAAVLLIHHSGKDAAKGSRGHSSLLGAIDTEIRVERDESSGIITAECLKQRDGATGEKIAFTLESVDLGSDEHGDPLTSCVVVASEEFPSAKRQKLSPQQSRAINELRNILASDTASTGRPKPGMESVTLSNLDEWRNALKRASVTDADNSSSERSQWKRIKDGLVNKGIIAIWDDKVWMP